MRALTTLLLLLGLAGCSPRQPDWDRSAAVARPGRYRPASAQGRPEVQLALDLWTAGDEPLDNQALAPLGILFCLDLARQGARGSTAAEIAKALGPAKVGDALRTLGEVAKSTNLCLGERLFVRPDLPLRPEFVKLVGAESIGTFTGQDTVDGWVSHVTQGQIQHLDLALGQVELLALSTLYLKAEWESPFHRGETRDRAFHVDQQTRQVPTMAITRRFQVATGHGYRVAELPYRGARLVFDCLLPDKVDGLASLEAALSRDELEATLGGLRQELVDLSLPRFRLERRVDLKAKLDRMGVRQAFKGDADFGGMTERRLSITDVIQQIRVEVDEKGTEVAAVAAVVCASAAPEAPPKLVEFRVDHPFLFLIRDRVSGLILVMGRVVYPQVSPRAPR